MWYSQTSKKDPTDVSPCSASHALTNKVPPCLRCSVRLDGESEMIRTCDVDVGAEGAQITSLRTVQYAVLPRHATLAAAGPFASKRSSRTCL